MDTVPAAGVALMLTWATTTVTILSGEATDEFGDATDGTTVAASGVPASLIEQSRTLRDPTDPAPRVVRFTTCRIPPTTAGLAITSDNRIRDEKTNAVYIIDSITPPSNPAWPQDIRLDLRRTTT